MQIWRVIIDNYNNSRLIQLTKKYKKNLVIWDETKQSSMDIIGKIPGYENS